MVIQKIELENYRNYEKLELDIDSDTNIFHGENAQGKTNILESIYVACTTKSHKRSKDKEIIQFGKDEAHIRLYLQKKGINYKIDMHLRKNKRKAVAINGIPIKKASELLGIANIVFFSPEDLNIIKNGPSERRRFVDMELCQLDRVYLSDLTSYNKCLEERNKLLKDISINRSGDNSILDTLDIWDIQLISFGKKVIEARKKFINALNPIIDGIHGSLSGNKEKIELRYEPDVECDDFEAKLKSSRNTDLRYCTTSVGPHRDDINFILNTTDLRKFGSQGQQRTASLALKLSEIELVRTAVNDEPVLLLDDVLSELDSSRQHYLLNSIGGIQTLITCTGLDEFVKMRFKIDKVFNVVNGSVMEE
ncbi:DNA replication and repair protein RecF [Lachnospiraceae bacterium KH1T2]|nr:DNA replication and repair protein RecF [Lachnospiraceae bacterium KH1T2]